MFRKYTALLTLLFFSASAFSQDVWSLQKCIQYATDHNIQIRQSELNEKVSKNLLLQSKADLLPNLNGEISYNFNFGRSIDITTYDFVNQQIQTNSASLTSAVTLFNGLSKINTIRQNQYDLKSKEYSTKDVENTVSLNITNAYLQILMSREELQTAGERLKLSNEQYQQTEKLVKAGVLPEGNLYDVEAQLLNDSLYYTVSNNSVILGKLTLALLLQLENPDSFDIEVPEITMPGNISLQNMNPENIYNTALGTQPVILSSNYNVQSAERRLAALRGLYYPSLSLFYNLRTNYSSIGQRNVEGEYVNDTLFQFPGLEPYVLTTPVKEHAPFFYQYQQNLYHTVGFSLSIPIFNGLQVRTSVRNAELNLLNARLGEQLVKDQLKNDIYVAYADAKAAFQKYFAAKKSSQAFSKSFEYTQKRFDLGASTNLEYSTARTNLANAENELIKAKYDFIFKLKVLDFYLGNPITLE